jgi:hypothetical protein
LHLRLELEPLDHLFTIAHEGAAFLDVADAREGGYAFAIGEDQGIGEVGGLRLS